MLANTVLTFQRYWGGARTHTRTHPHTHTLPFSPSPFAFMHRLSGELNRAKHKTLNCKAVVGLNPVAVVCPQKCIKGSRSRHALHTASTTVQHAVLPCACDTTDDQRRLAPPDNSGGCLGLGTSPLHAAGCHQTARREAPAGAANIVRPLQI